MIADAHSIRQAQPGLHVMTPLIASLLTEPVGVAHYLVVGAVLFVCGALCMATKRNAIGVLLGIELVLNGANLNFIAFGSPYLQNQAGINGMGTIGLDGQLMSLFVIVLAAAEAAVALAIALNFYNSFSTIDVDQADQLQG
jgi:NADH:ubiquinone oxidoreductase subunit K